MMLPASSDAAPGAPLRIRQDDKFYCRLLARERSAAGTGAGTTPSFRVYYGGASCAVPFVWESQPGTPKHPCSGGAGALPPLTPPPSYHCSPGRATWASPSKASHGSNLVRTIMPRLARRKCGRVPPPSPQASSLSSSSPRAYASSSTGYSPCHGRQRWSSSARSPFSPVGGEEEPAMCFGPVRHGSYLGCCKMVAVKKALLCIVGHGSSRVA